MNDYVIKIYHPERGEQSDLPGQGQNAYEALENAVGSGSIGSWNEVMTALVRNIATGFTVKIEYMLD